MKKRVNGLMAAASLLLLVQTPAFSEEKTEGKVVGTRLTHCDMNVKIGGCAGTMKLERTAGEKKEELSFNVPLGTPITRGSEAVYLPALRGRTVVVTHVTEKNERVAKAIELK
ncbi:MAG TPA: hypothetical protein VF226_06680 [Hyphomicrobiaceae bacterium]